MKVLLKALRNSKDLTCLFNFCENNGIEILRNSYTMTLDDIKLEETRVVINWGGYGSSFEIGSNLFNYFKLDYPGGTPPRGKTFTHVKMILNGDLKNNDTEEVIQRVEKLGGLVVQDVDDKVNLMVIGEKADKQLLKKAEELNQVLILDEERFIEILPAIRKEPIKRKVKPRKDLPTTVDKKVLDSLKKFFISRNNDLISQGLEMLRSLKNADISKYFLDGVQYTALGDGRLVPNPTFTGTGPAQPYLNYALLGVIAYAPDDCEIANNLRSSVKYLNIETSASSPLAEFKNLESLDLSNSEELENLDGIASLKKLEHIEINNCKALKSLKGLLNKNLETTSLDLSYFQYLENLEGVQSMNKLKKIVLEGCNSLKNVDALKNLTHLEKVELNNLRSLESLEGLKALEKSATEFDLYGFEALKNLNGIQNFHKLQYLRISSESLSDITALNGLQSLKKLDIDTRNLTLLKGIESLPKLEILEIWAPIVKSLDGLKDLNALNKMVINCTKMNSLKGLEEAPNITDLRIHSEDLEDITRINSLTKLKTLNLSSCNSIQNLHGLEKLNFLESIDLADCTKLISLEGVPNPSVFGSDVQFYNCSSLKDITALKGISKIRYMDLSGSSSISKTEGLENIEIDSLACTNPDKNLLQNLSNLKVKTLRLSEMGMTSFEGLKKWESVTTLEVEANLDDSNQNKSFKSLLGINAFPNIKILCLGNEYSNSCNRLENLTGVEKLKHLEELDLTRCSAMKDVNSLSELPNLLKLRMDGCIHVEPLPRPKVMENRAQVEKYQLRLLKALGKVIPVTAKKESIGSKNEKSSVDRKTLSKIKKLLTARDFNLIDQGVELVRSLEDHSLYQELLNGIQYKMENVYNRRSYSLSKEEEGVLIPNKLFKGTEPAQPYLNHAMLGLINNAPNDFAQEIRNEVRILNIDVFGDFSNFTNLEKLFLAWSYHLNDSDRRTISSFKEFSNFEKLTHLSVYPCPKDDQDLKGLSNLKKLRELNLSGDNISLKTLIGLENCRELQTLEISGCRQLMDVEGLNGCQELKSIELSYAKRLKNINGLQGLKALKTVNISDSESLENLDGFQGCNSLEEINIRAYRKPPLKNVDGLIGLKELNNVNFSGFHSLKNVNGFEGCTALESLSIESDSLENLNGLQNMKALKSISVFAKKIKTLDGLAGCENLEGFRIDGESLENLNGLKGCNKWKELDIPSSPSSLNIDVLADMDGLRRINFEGCNLTSFELTRKIPRIMGVKIISCNELKSLEGVENFINLTKIVIKDCTKLENLKGLDGTKTLESVIIQDCKSLKDVDALLSLPKLEILKMRSCGIKKEELPEHLQVMVETTISYDDWNIDDNS